MKRPDGFDGFYVCTPDGLKVVPERILLWIIDSLESFPDRERYRWKVEFGYKADRIFRELFGHCIYKIGYKEWMKIYSRREGEWEIRLRIAGQIGDKRDMFGHEEIDRIMISLDIDDLDAMGYYDPYWRY